MSDERKQQIVKERRGNPRARFYDAMAASHSSFITPHSSLRTSCSSLLLLAGPLIACSIGCPRTLQPYASPLPRVLPATPTLEQVIEVVHRNSSQIRAFSTSRASISGPDFPTIACSIAFERAKRFRLKAGGLTGTEVDLGSNDELFWFWMRRGQPPAMYYCRHDQFAAMQARQMLPLDPSLLIEMLGVAEFDPALPHQGPFPQPDGRLRIDTLRDTPEGPVKRITFVDAAQGWIVAQYQYDARQQLVASSVAGGHRQDPLSGLVLPTVVALNFPPAQMAMRIELGNVEINQISGNPAELWAMPNYPGATLVDLANPPQQAPAVTATPISRANRPSFMR